MTIEYSIYYKFKGYDDMVDKFISGNDKQKFINILIRKKKINNQDFNYSKNIDNFPLADHII